MIISDSHYRTRLIILLMLFLSLCSCLAIGCSQQGNGVEEASVASNNESRKNSNGNVIQSDNGGYTSVLNANNFLSQGNQTEISGDVDDVSESSRHSMTTSQLENTEDNGGERLYQIAQENTTRLLCPENIDDFSNYIEGENVIPDRYKTDDNLVYQILKYGHYSQPIYSKTKNVLFSSNDIVSDDSTFVCYHVTGTATRYDMVKQQESVELPAELQIEFHGTIVVSKSNGKLVFYNIKQEV